MVHGTDLEVLRGGLVERLPSDELDPLLLGYATKVVCEVGSETPGDVRPRAVLAREEGVGPSRPIQLGRCRDIIYAAVDGEVDGLPIRPVIRRQLRFRQIEGRLERLQPCIDVGIAGCVVERVVAIQVL